MPILAIFIFTIFLCSQDAASAAGPRTGDIRGRSKDQAVTTTDPKTRSAAIERAALEGCLDGLSGDFLVATKVVSSCFAGGFVSEVLVYPPCDGEECKTDRSRPLAKLTSHCDNELSKAHCLSKKQDRPGRTGG